MSDATLALQTAIYQRLTGDATLMATLAGVHDQVPEEAAFPYVTLGEDTAVDLGTKSEPGQDITVTLHAWSRARGRREVKEILARIYDLMHEQALTVAGFSHVLTRFAFGATFRDPDGLTQHGVARYRIVVQ
jgi:hypothetical protein